MQKILKTGLALFAVLSLETSPVWAAASNASYGSAWSNGNTVYVKDTKGDNTGVYANYYRAGAKLMASLYNNSGVGNVVSRNTGSRVTTLQVCLNKWGPNICAAWG